MPAISPQRNNNTTPDIQFSDEFGNVLEFALDGGVAGITESPDRPTTLLKNTAGTKYGDFDNNFAHIEMSTFDGGFGQEQLDDVTKFLYSEGMWTQTPDHAHNSLLRQFGTGIRSCDSYLPDHDFSWVPLYGNSYYIDTAFAASASYSAAQGAIWVRRVGNPGTLTFAICADSSGVPDTVLETKTLNLYSMKPEDARLLTFTFAAAEALTSGTTYHIKVYSGSPYTDINHWEIGCGRGFSNLLPPSTISTDGTTWSNTSFRMFYRLTDANTKRQFHFFLLEGCLYAVDEKNNSANSVVYMNGDRGTADDNTSDKNTLIDATRSWTVNEYKGYRVKIVEGPGVGENRYVVSNTATALTVDSAWQTTHTTSSRYVICGGPKWTAITLTGTALTGRVKNVTVFKAQAAFAKGQDANILKMTNSASAHAGAEDGSNKADLVYTCFDTSSDKNVLWRGENSGTNAGKVSFGETPAVGASTTFGTATRVGDPTGVITNMYYYDDKLYVSKDSGLWTLQGGKARHLPTGFEAGPSPTNGLILFGKNFYLITNWSHSIERYYGTTMDDFGMFKSAGMPSNRRGYFASGTAPIGWQFYAVNGGSGYSSVWAFNDRGWHQVMAGFEPGQQINNVFWQPVDGGNSILWTDYGGDLVYMVFPNDEINPLKDETVSFEPVGFLDTSRIDLGMAQIPKYVKDVDIISENLGGGDTYSLEYQVDGEIGTEYWRRAGDAYESPVAKVPILESGVRNIGLRLRSYANDLHRPPVLRSIVAKMFGRSPYTRQWSIRVKIDQTTKNGVAVSPFKLHEIYRMLSEASKTAGGLTMHSIVPEMDDITVVVEPPSPIRSWVRSLLWGGTIILTVREVG